MVTVTEGSFNREKFEEMILYVAERTQGDAGFGRTKLAKVLFYSDLESFRRTGEAITNAEYQNWDHGPYPPKLRNAALTLERAGAVEPSEPTGEFDPHRLVVTGRRHADLARAGVSAAQRAIIDEWIEKISRPTARAVRQASHEHPGYKLVARNETIPYASAFLATAPPSADDVAELEQFGREQGLLIGDEWKW